MKELQMNQCNQSKGYMLENNWGAGLREGSWVLNNLFFFCSEDLDQLMKKLMEQGHNSICILNRMHGGIEWRTSEENILAVIPCRCGYWLSREGL